MTASLDDWLKRHPLLEPIARLESTMSELVKALPRPALKEVSFDAYAAEYQEGIALLRGKVIGRRLLLASATTFDGLTAALIKAPIPESLAAKTRDLHKHLRRAPESIGDALVSIATGAEEASKLPQPGLARYVAWAAINHALSPAFDAFNGWRQNAEWPRGYCPTCGAAPVLAALTPKDEGRQRSLICAVCGNRWTAPRLGCPHCGSAEAKDLGIFELNAEPELRLDVCNNCKGYLKTWTGPGAIAPYFCDWATLHLDALAAERGYLRLGASLYDL